MEEKIESEAGSAVEDANGADSSQQRARPRPRTAKALPTDRLKFDAQVQALKALAMESHNGTRAVGAVELARRLGVADTTAGLNNNFFTEAGLAVKAGKGKYKPTEAALAFEREAGFDQAAAAKKNLAGPLVQTWFYKEIKSQIALGDAAEGRVIAVLASAAGASTAHRPKLTSVLEWLKLAGLITIKGGQVRLADDAAPETENPEPEPNPETPATPEQNGGSPEGEKPTKIIRQDRGPVVLEINFSCSYTAKDLAELDPEQIKALYEAVGGVQAVQAVLLKGREKT